VFYRQTSGGDDPLGVRFQAFLVIQRAATARSADPPEVRFPPPGAPRGASATDDPHVIELSRPIEPAGGLHLVDCRTGSWYRVVEVSGARVRLSRPAEGLGRVRPMAHVVAVHTTLLGDGCFQTGRAR
jgi:hypothetical protein